MFLPHAAGGPPWSITGDNEGTLSFSYGVIVLGKDEKSGFAGAGGMGHCDITPGCLSNAANMLREIFCFPCRT